jgi:hypothetical protein
MNPHDHVFETLDPLFVLQGFALYGLMLAGGILYLTIAAVREHIKTRRNRPWN